MHQSSPPRRPIIPVSHQQRGPAANFHATVAELPRNATTRAAPPPDSSASTGEHQQLARRTSLLGSLAGSLRRLREPAQAQAASGEIPQTSRPQPSERLKHTPSAVSSTGARSADMQQNVPPSGTALAKRQGTLLGTQLSAPQLHSSVQIGHPVKKSLQAATPRPVMDAAGRLSPVRQAANPQNSKPRQDAGSIQSRAQLQLSPSQVEPTLLETFPDTQPPHASNCSSPASPPAMRKGGSLTPNAFQRGPTSSTGSSSSPAVSIEIAKLDPNAFGLPDGSMTILGLAAVQPGSGRVLATGQG